ncbi:MAG: hypothetical protein WA707_15805, partial [Pseudolabrys sp.]
MKNGSLLTQWFAKYGYVPIILIGMAGLAPEIRAGERKSGDTIVAEAPVVAEPASKGYIMYANSPAHWTPVSLPDEINSDRGPHNNIRAEIEQAAMLFDVDVRMMKVFAEIESGYNPKATTGKYKCLFQLSDWEFGPNTGMATSTTSATARSRRPERLRLRPRSSRRTSVVRPRQAEIYCIHQQGYQG